MTELVGILNLTPDSFSDGGEISTNQEAVSKAQKLFDEGAAIIDVGAESTRPGAVPVSWQEEVFRLSDFIKYADTMDDWRLSIDTYHPETVNWVSNHLSEFIINDVTGFRNPNMRHLAAELGHTVILSHLPEISTDIQNAHKEKPIASVEQVVEEITLSVERLISDGVKKEKIILDPGIGFGKTRQLNRLLLWFGQIMYDYPVMIGYSRKKFLGDNRYDIEVNYAAGKTAADAHAKYLRVHDVAGHFPIIQSQLKSESDENVRFKS